MEYVVVSYPGNRTVLIDGQPAGNSNDTLMVEAGHHVFAVDGDPECRPPTVEKAVRDTTPVKPMLIDDFHPAGGVG